MKVLLVAHVGYPWGGVSQRYSDLLGSSLPQKIELTFFESSPNKKSTASTGSVNSQNLFGSLSMIFDFIKTLGRVKPDIVHIASAFGFSFIKHSFLILIAKIYGCKVILAPHCSISVFVPKPGLAYQWMKFVLDRCDGMVVLSSEWMDISKVSPKPKIALLKNSINISRYLGIERSLQTQNDPVRMIFLGHIGAEKGVMDLIQAVKILHDRGISGYQVWIYGEDLHPGETGEAKELVSSLGVEDFVQFSEAVFGDEKMEVIRKADIFTLPSHHEGLPISVIEAMAAGLPVIATCVGGIPDLINSSISGILVNPMDPPKLAEALNTLIQNSTLRLEYGLAARRTAAENHDVENYVGRLVNFYEEVRRK